MKCAALPMLGLLSALLFQSLDAGAQSNLVAATSPRHGLVSLEDTAEWTDWSSVATGIVCWITFATPPIGSSNVQWDASQNALDAWQTNSAATPAWTSAHSGSVRFDGTNDALRLGTNALNFGTNNFAVATWVWCERTNSIGMIASKIGAFGAPGWNIRTDRSFVIQSGTDAVQTAVGNFPTSEWAFVAGGRASTSIFFTVTNGPIYVAGTSTVFNLTTTNEAMIAGRWAGGSPINFFAGRVGEFMAWNRALTSNEIAAVFQATRRRYGI